MSQRFLYCWLESWAVVSYWLDADELLDARLAPEVSQIHRINLEESRSSTWFKLLTLELLSKLTRTLSNNLQDSYSDFQEIHPKFVCLPTYNFTSKLMFVVCMIINYRRQPQQHYTLRFKTSLAHAHGKIQNSSVLIYRFAFLLRIFLSWLSPFRKAGISIPIRMWSKFSPTNKQFPPTGVSSDIRSANTRRKLRKDD